MEALTTVLKRFWPNYNLKKTMNHRKSASRKQDWKDVFKDRYSYRFFLFKFNFRSVFSRIINFAIFF